MNRNLYPKPEVITSVCSKTSCGIWYVCDECLFLHKKNKPPEFTGESLITEMSDGFEREFGYRLEPPPLNSNAPVRVKRWVKYSSERSVVVVRLVTSIVICTCFILLALLMKWIF